MELEGYMSLIKSCYINRDILRLNIDTLELFVQKEYSSVYQICSYIKSAGLKVSYKNVHKKIRKLLSFHLIEEKEVHEPKHGAIYYRLSEFGIYYLFLKRLDGILFDQVALKKSQIIVFNATNFLKYYSTNALFEIFLYPYFDKETILSINSPDFIIEIFRYLHDCCKEIDNMLSLLNNNMRQIPILKELFSWNKIPGEDNMKLMASLEQIFNLKGEAQPDIKKIDNGMAIQVTTQNTCFFVKLDLQRRKVVATVSDAKDSSGNRQYEYDYVQLNKDFKISLTKTAEESLVDDLDTERLAEILLLRLVLKLATSYEQESTKSLKLFSEDTTFMQLIENTHKGFEESYQKLMSMRRNS